MSETSATKPSAGINQPPKIPYVPPTLEHLGKWHALTLQQSVPVDMFQNPSL